MEERKDTDQADPSSTDNEQVDNGTVDTPVTLSNNTKKWRPQRKHFLIVGIVLLALGSLTGAYFLGKGSQNKSTATNGTQNQVVTEQPKQTVAKPIEGNTFLETAKKLDNLHFYKSPETFFGNSCSDLEQKHCEPQIKSDDIYYYQIGTTKAGEMIIKYTLYTGTIDSQDHTAIKKADGKYAVLTKQDPGFTNIFSNPTYGAQTRKEHEAAFSPNVTFDDATTIPEYDFPTTLSVKEQSIKQPDYGTGQPPYLLANGLGDLRGGRFNSTDTSAVEKIGSVGDKTIYRVAGSKKQNFTVYEFYATIKQVLAESYVIDDSLVGKSDPLNITWTRGESNQTVYFSAAAGCGSAGGYVAANNINTSSLIQVGTAPDGRKLYQMPASSALTLELYNEDYAKGQDLEKAELKNLTAQQFLDKHGYFLVQDSLGEYILLQRGDMFIRGGCAKPVVYLYPQTTTDVSVSVGADVTLSDPLYPQGGWQHVIAQPNGQLSYNGKQYGSLFWEGYGHGRYPEITSGTVVARVNAVATIRSQLQLQGLNQQETNDFLAYWTPKLPNTPYVRLTWLSTGQLEKLAPLNISPRPNTLVRVFLDFEGLQQPVNMPTQKLSNLKRTGFTVVEWGGLARDGSVPALR